MGRVSREQATLNRAKVIETAATLFRKKGLAGVNIADLMAEAGFTHGGFYGQFGSKEELAGEAASFAFGRSENRWADAGGETSGGRMSRLARYYLNQTDCPMATLAGDAALSPAGSPLRKAFSAGTARLAAMVKRSSKDDRELAVFAALVGAAVLRRASDNAEMADAFDAAVLSLAAEADKPRRAKRATPVHPSD